MIPLRQNATHRMPFDNPEAARQPCAPALLNLEATGLDLSAIDPAMVDQIDFFYVNKETGRREQMRNDSLIIDLDAGYIKLVNARLPHFSRHAIAHSQ